MKTRLYYLTRSFAPYQKGGGPLMRQGAVKYLNELGWDVIVIMPNYNSKELIIEDNIIQIPIEGIFIQKLASLFERVGIYEDYLDKWVENAYKYLKDVVNKNDIIFSTSGGDLATIKLGSLMKEKVKCKFVINFRDPLNYSLVHNLKIDNKFHISREKVEFKYLKNSDKIITSSISNMNSLLNKYPMFKEKISNNYFGFIKLVNTHKYKKKSSLKVRIAYAGSMLSKVQRPEVLFEAYLKLADKSNFEIYYIGNINDNHILNKIKDKNIIFINHLNHEEYLKFMCENIDIGFVSLSNEYYGACVPSKIYEYINLELPIIGVLPNSDGMDIINNYGYSCKYDDIDKLKNILIQIQDKDKIKNFKNRIIKDKKLWSMAHKIQEVNKILRRLG